MRSKSGFDERNYKKMEKTGVFINGKSAGVITSVDFPITSFESPNFKKGGDPNRYVYYMRRGDRIWMKNEYGKLSVEADGLGNVMKGIKYGEKLTIDMSL